MVLPDSALKESKYEEADRSQCTYRCVVLPDFSQDINKVLEERVSMHLQVRGAP